MGEDGFMGVEKETDYQQQLERVLSQMTLEEKVLQMHQLSPSAISSEMLNAAK